MNCCQCTNTLTFCKQDICGAIDFDIQAQIPGVHKLVVDFLGVQIKVLAYFEAGDQIIFSTALLNESFEYTGNIYDPNGAKIVIRKNSIDYDCFKFQTVISLYAETPEIPESGL